MTAALPTPLRLADLVDSPDLREILLDHARRGLRVQAIARALLATLMLLTVLLLPPARLGGWCLGLAIGYLGWAVATVVVARTAGLGPIRYMWLALLIDLSAVAALSVLTGVTTASWTSDVLVYGFFLLPVLAAAQLRPWLCVAVCAPTVVLYFAAGAAGRVPNGDEPWTSIVLRTGVLAVACVGAVLLSRVQLSRVLTVGSLAAQRAALSRDLVDLAEREQRRLAESLHDGALQFVLAARMDLEDLSGQVDEEVYARLEAALTETAGQLRATVSDLHPAVLEAVGLPAALRDLTATVAGRSGLTVELDTTGWPDDARTGIDGVLYGTARELLGNVVKHARARVVEIELALVDGLARLVVTDDGGGMSDDRRALALAGGHIGLQSHRARLAGLGGRLEVESRPGGGTVATATLPVTASVRTG
jgi:two-component system NarL family sensor kinase